ncbi:MAG: YsnF/AvaK domain-containing protein, partial [Chloroflexota bacterium]|nr:YsnF/AvaK domain-containing protein [Chloroflexota bacterium]
TRPAPAGGGPSGTPAGDSAPTVPAVTTDPARLPPFTPGTLSIPVRGERLAVERRIVVTREWIVRKIRRHETVEVGGTVRKERVEVTRRAPVAPGGPEGDI